MQAYVLKNPEYWFFDQNPWLFLRDFFVSNGNQPVPLKTIEETIGSDAVRIIKDDKRRGWSTFEPHNGNKSKGEQNTFSLRPTVYDREVNMLQTIKNAGKTEATAA